MTAPLQKTHNISSFMDGFIQTVQNNDNLDARFLKGVDVNQKDYFGFTGLYWAISHHNMHNLKLLIDHGSTLQVTSNTNALFYAIDCNNFDALKYFIDKGIDKNITRVTPAGKHYTLIEHALRLKRKVITEYLK